MKKILVPAALILSFNLSAQISGINLANIDKSVDPRDDFYQFANGTWLKTAQIPGNESAWGSFNEIIDRNNDNLKKILEECANDKSAAPGSNKQKIRDFYMSGMDSVKLEKEGYAPIKPFLADIDKISSTKDLFATTGKFHKKGIAALFNFVVFVDLKSSKENNQYFGQAQLGLPDKMFYSDAKYEKIREAYKKHLENLFVLIGENAETAKKSSEAVFNLESKMAEVSMGRLELRNPEAQYNKFTKDEFFKKTSNFDFNTYLDALGVKTPFTDVVVSQPLFFEKMNEMIKTVPLADWKIYMKWRLMHEAATYMSSAFEKENFSFYGMVLQGTKTMKPRWKRTLRTIDGGVGEALGQIFVDKYFNADAKKKVNSMVDNLFAAFKQRIETRDWMSAETKTKALEKLSMISRKLGYPDKWKDYSTLAIKNDSYVDNVFRSSEFAVNEMLSYIGKPVDKTKWGMTPPTVNAYYNPPNNEIVFPAGIMQPPFFNSEADDAMNYGVMGAVIGHELTHGFDDQGCKFDGTGNMVNWWTDSDKKRFEERTAVIRDQFSAFVAIDTLHVNGQLTLGENIADLGGLTMAYNAYKMSLGGKKSTVIDGYTGEQRFFIAWAQAWKIMMRPEYLKQMIATNPHSPGNFRANAPLTNLKAFYEAFSVTENNKMYKPADKRAEVW
ncbi:MAG: M13 family metallopeptidase [Bacteroidia bacterium]